MTDTQRTLDELLTIFHDNNSQDITPQDMRDFAVSTPASPTYQNAGYDIVFKDNTTALVTLANGGSGFGTTQILPFGANKTSGAGEVTAGVLKRDDSYSLAGSDPTSAYGLDLVAGNSFMFERGIWGWHAGMSVAAADAIPYPNAGKGNPPMSAYLDQVRYNPTFVADGGLTDGSEPFQYDWFVNPINGDFSVPLTGQFGTNAAVFFGGSGAVIQDKEDPQPFAVYAYTTPGTDFDIDLVNYQLQWWRIA